MNRVTLDFMFGELTFVERTLFLAAMGVDYSIARCLKMHKVVERLVNAKKAFKPKYLPLFERVMKKFENYYRIKIND